MLLLVLVVVAHLVGIYDSREVFTKRPITILLYKTSGSKKDFTPLLVFFF